MRHREAQVGDAGFEVSMKLARPRLLPATVGDDPGRKLARSALSVPD